MPLCLEQKHLLTGEINTYQCELLHFEPGFGILKYVIDREYNIHGHRLTPGDVTIALYWEDRPYTLYLWKLRSGGTLHYFNIADRVTLSPREFSWRDLVIDILVDERGEPHVLDEQELPQNLDGHLKTYIQAAQQHILSSHRALMEETNGLLQQNL